MTVDIDCRCTGTRVSGELGASKSRLVGLRCDSGDVRSDQRIDFCVMRQRPMWPALR